MHSRHRHRRRAVTLVVAATALAGLAVAGRADAVGANLQVAVTHPPNPMAPGTVFTSDFSVTNAGDIDSVPTLITISMPKATTLSSITRALSITGGIGISCTSYSPRYGNIQRRCTVPAIAPGASIVLGHYKVTGPATVPFTGVATSVSVSGPNNFDSALYRFLGSGPADLTGYVSAAGTVFVGGPTSTSGSISDGGYSPTGGFDWHVELPLGATAIAPGTVANTTCTTVAHGVDCSTTNLGNGATMSYSIAFNAPTTPGTYSVTTTLDTANSVIESNEANNVSTSGPLTVPGDAVNFAVSVSQPASADRYSVFTRDVTVANTGGSDALNVSFIDRFTQFPWVAQVSGNCHSYITHSGRPSRAHYNGVACTIGTVPAGSTVTMSYALSVPGTLAATTYTDTVSVGTTSFQQPTSAPAGSGTLTVTVAASPVAATNTVAPVITGNAVAGESLASTTGTWIGAPTITYAYQWLRCDAAGANCNAIGGATAANYAVQPGDASFTLRSSVLATNGGGTTVAQSAPSAIVIGALAPTNTIAPTLLAGLEKQPTFAWGVTTGTWSGTPTITYAYQWLRCNIGGGGCADIGGATASSYVLQTADVFHSVQVRVTAANNAGSGVAYSNVSPEIDPFG